MADAASPAAYDIEEQRARIERAQEETRKFVAEQIKLMAEQIKMTAKAAKLGRDRALAPWQVALSGMAAGAALFGTGAAFIKILGSDARPRSSTGSSGHARSALAAGGDDPSRNA